MQVIANFNNARKYFIFLGLIIAALVLIYIDNIVSYLSTTQSMLTFKLAGNYTSNNKNELINSTIEKTKAVLEFYSLIRDSEFKVYSQNKEDGVIQKLIYLLALPTYNRKYVEFGTQDGTETNTRYLKDKYKWNGLLMDGSHQDLTINLHKETITHDNIINLFEKYNVQIEFDILSVDTDYADYWILESILKSQKYFPKVIIHEVNKGMPNECIAVPKPVNLTFWDGTNLLSANVCGYYCLAQKFNYTVVYCETQMINCFWARNDILSDALFRINKYTPIPIGFVQKIWSPNFLYRRTNLSFSKDVDNRFIELKKCF